MAQEWMDQDTRAQVGRAMELMEANFRRRDLTLRQAGPGANHVMQAYAQFVETLAAQHDNELERWFDHLVRSRPFTGEWLHEVVVDARQWREAPLLWHMSNQAVDAALSWYFTAVNNWHNEMVFSRNSRNLTDNDD